MGENAEFVFAALGKLGVELLKAMDGGDVETTKKLTVALPEGVRIEAEGRATKAAQRARVLT